MTMIPNAAGRARSFLSGLTVAGLVVPVLTLIVHNDTPTKAAAGAAIAALALALTAYFAPRPRMLRLFGLVLVALASWLLAQISYPLTAWLVAAFLGVGLGLVLPPARPRSLMPGALLGAAALAGIALISIPVALAVAVSLALVSLVAPGLFDRAEESRVWRSGAAPRRAAQAHPGVAGAFGIALLLGSSLTTAWVGASTPKAAWFGDVVSHGPRGGDEVAITFDDGPNATYSLQIRDILDRYGVKATFFTVGKALDQRPDVSKALLDDGMLLGDHSYHHDSTSWLDPRYREIPETQASFQLQLGVCPAFFRPPHGTHTPLMGHVAADRGMTMITWDVSAGDWATTDGNLVAQRVLAQVQPGSIILLHDSIDGNVDADRAVILTALPQILDGLREKGLQPVRLDQLLNKPAYVPCRAGG